MGTIDLRSDTVTKPSRAMRAAIAAAEVGDDVYGEDPSVRRLEELAARRVGKEAALFVPSGTMANQISLGVLTRPGDEIVCDAGAHCISFESGALAALGGARRAGFATALWTNNARALTLPALDRLGLLADQPEVQHSATALRRARRSRTRRERRSRRGRRARGR